MHRFIFWCLVAITCAVVFFGPATAASLNTTIMSTTGNVGGIVVGGAPSLIDGFRNGIQAGGGGDQSSIFRTFDAQQRRGGGQVAAAQVPQQRLVVDRRDRRDRRDRDGRGISAARADR